LVRELDLDEDVSLPGFVDNPYAYMARSAVFVLSSVWEGLPTVLIEAMAVGTPVVATDCPSGPREIAALTNACQLVPISNPVVLSRAIIGYLEKPHRNMNLDLEAFTLSSAVNAYKGVLLCQ